MRLVIQKVLEASVSVQGTQISKIGKGFLILLGITHNDNQDTVQKYVDQVLNMKVWSDPVPTKTESSKLPSEPKEEEKTSTGDLSSNTNDGDNDKSGYNVVENGYEVIVVSQFTLYGKLKGNKPDFHGALNSDEAYDLYNNFVESMKKSYREDKIQTGKFGNRMAVQIVNDGPTTIILDSEKD